MPDTNNSNNVTHETGGFFAYGLSGMFQGAAIILFAFIAFDAMIMSRYTNLFGKQQRFANDGCEKIENFITTIPNAILSINAGLFLCLLGMALALTTIQPYHLLVSVYFKSFSSKYLGALLNSFMAIRTPNFTLILLSGIGLLTFYTLFMV